MRLCFELISVRCQTYMYSYHIKYLIANIAYIHCMHVILETKWFIVKASWIIYSIYALSNNTKHDI